MEILRRKIKIDKENLADKRVQFSINSYGHFAMRIFDPDKPDEDILIVLGMVTTRELIGFIRKWLTYSQE